MVKVIRWYVKPFLYFSMTSLAIKMTTMFPTVIQSPIGMVIADKVISIIYYGCSRI